MAEQKENYEINLNLLKRVLAMAKPYKWLFVATILLAVIMAPVSTMIPYLVKVMVDDYIMNYDIPGLQKMSIIFLGVIVLGAGLRYTFTLSTAYLGQSVIKDLRVKVFDKIVNLNLAYFNKTAIGTSTTRTINDIEAINQVFQQGVITIIADILSVFAVLGIMFYTSWRLTLISLIMMPFMILATYIFKEKVRIAYQKVRTQVTKMNAFLQERISGMKIVQIFNAEEKEMAKFKTINKDYTQANLDSITYYAIFFPVVELISAIALALMVWLGARSHLEGFVSFGALVAFPLYLNLLFRPVRMLADKFNQLQMGLVAADRVFKVVDQDQHVENNGTIQPEALSGKIEFNNVFFAYENDNFVIHDLSFLLQPGETMAIVGSTGSGKSTIINLLCRFYDINSGSICVDDIDIKKMDIYAYRKHISIVLQDVFLFNGNVAQNISLMDESVTREQVIEAAKTIGAHKFIMQLPGGYDYRVMERGNNLSVGQRQLISFVRALVFNPDILILDEATSSIDTETEAVIQHAIETLIEKRTSIIIAHRLSTVKNADKIMVLDKGQIVEMGTHQELLQNPKGRYKELHDLQWVEA